MRSAFANQAHGLEEKPGTSAVNSSCSRIGRAEILAGRRADDDIDPAKPTAQGSDVVMDEHPVHHKSHR
jgi:hypothetical protein